MATFKILSDDDKDFEHQKLVAAYVKAYIDMKRDKANELATILIKENVDYAPRIRDNGVAKLYDEKVVTGIINQMIKDIDTEKQLLKPSAEKSDMLEEMPRPEKGSEEAKEAMAKARAARAPISRKPAAGDSNADIFRKSLGAAEARKRKPLELPAIAKKMSPASKAKMMEEVGKARAAKAAKEAEEAEHEAAEHAEPVEGRLALIEEIEKKLKKPVEEMTMGELKDLTRKLRKLHCPPISKMRRPALLNESRRHLRGAGETAEAIDAMELDSKSITELRTGLKALREEHCPSVSKLRKPGLVAEINKLKGLSRATKGMPKSHEVAAAHKKEKKVAMKAKKEEADYNKRLDKELKKVEKGMKAEERASKKKPAIQEVREAGGFLGQ